ncbi:hypothetical protein D3C73_531030 [compost metagenome]
MIIKTCSILIRIPEFIRVEGRHIRQTEDFHRIRIGGYDTNRLGPVFVIRLLHCLFNIVLNRAVYRQLEITPIYHGLVGILGIGKLDPLAVTLIGKTAVSTFELLVKIFLQPHNRLTVSVCIAQDMCG